MFGLGAVLTPVAALSQEWTTYTYPDPGFAIQFPGAPVVETGKVKNSTGTSLPMTRYVVRQEHVVYTLSVVNYSSTNADALSTITETERALKTSGTVTAAGGARVNRNHGRKLAISGADGSRSDIAIFFVDGHLYTLTGQALPPHAIEHSGDPVHFLDSLQFLGDEGGFGRFFGGGGEDRIKTASNPHTDAPSPRSDVSNPHTDATCAGKSAGDAVQLETPGGLVAATCTLVARPNKQGAAPPP
jgi:hypothetical protein